MPGYDVNLRDYWRIIRKRKGIVIFTILLVGGLNAGFSFTMKAEPIYEATARVKVERVTALAGIFGESAQGMDSSTDNMATQAQVIRSFVVLEQVAKRLGLLDVQLTTDEILATPQYLSVIRRLKDQTKTVQEGFTSLIDISATAGTPQFAARLANTVADVYREQAIEERNKRVIEARKFIEKQLGLVGGQLKTAEEDVKEYRQQANLVSVDAQGSVLLGRISREEEELERMRRRRADLASAIRQLEMKPVAGQRVDVVALLEGGSRSFESLQAQLGDLRIKRETLLQDFTEAHPEVQNLDIQIRAISETMIKDLRAQDTLLGKREEAIEADLKSLRAQYQALPGEGLNLARLMREVQVNQDVFSLLRQREQEARIREAAKLEEVTIVTPALVPQSPKNPPLAFPILFLGVLLGAVLGVVFAFIVESIDTSISAIEDVEAFLGVPVFGVLPHVDLEEVKASIADRRKSPASDELLSRMARLVAHFDPMSVMAEGFRALRTNVQFLSVDKGIKTIAVTSTENDEGKSHVAVNLAITMAQAGLKTLLIDGDLRKPVVHKIFGIERVPGLSDILVGNANLPEAARTVTDVLLGEIGFEDLMITPGLGNLSVLTSGVDMGNPAELLYSQRFKGLLEQLRGEYDIVILDSSPVLQAADTAVLCSQVEGTVIVYRVGQVARGALRRTKAQLEHVQARIVGIVLNGLRPEVSPDFHTMRYYKGYYAYGKKGRRKRKSGLRRWLSAFPFGFRQRRVGQEEGQETVGQGRGAELPEPPGRRWISWVFLIGLLVALVLAGWYWIGLPSKPQLRRGAPFGGLMEGVTPYAKVPEMQDASDQDGKKVAVVKAAQDASIYELIKASGYDIDEKDLGSFLSDFISLNRTIKSLSIIPKGTTIRLPLKNLIHKGQGFVNTRAEKTVETPLCANDSETLTPLCQ